MTVVRASLRSPTKVLDVEDIGCRAASTAMPNLSFDVVGVTKSRRATTQTSTRELLGLALFAVMDGAINLLEWGESVCHDDGIGCSEVIQVLGYDEKVECYAS